MDQKIINDIIIALPKGAVDTVSDFIRASLILGWGSTRHLLGKVLEFVSLVKTKDISAHDLDARIKSIEREIQIELNCLVRSYTDAKFADDPLYQKWVQKR